MFLHNIDLYRFVGKKFHQLLVVDVSEKTINHRKYVKVECDCGKSYEIRYDQLGVTKSCGCRKKNKKFLMQKNFAKLPTGESYTNRVFKKYQISAKKRNKEFSLSKTQFIEIISKNCKYCDEPPNFYYNKGESHLNGRIAHNGIDRVDNNIGYIYENSVPCCWVCNKLKGILGADAFIKHCKKVAKYNTI